MSDVRRQSAWSLCRERGHLTRWGRSNHPTAQCRLAVHCAREQQAGLGCVNVFKNVRRSRFARVSEVKGGRITQDSQMQVEGRGWCHNSRLYFETQLSRNVQWIPLPQTGPARRRDREVRDGGRSLVGCRFRQLDRGPAHSGLRPPFTTEECTFCPGLTPAAMATGWAAACGIGDCQIGYVIRAPTDARGSCAARLSPKHCSPWEARKMRDRDSEKGAYPVPDGAPAAAAAFARGGNRPNSVLRRPKACGGERHAAVWRRKKGREASGRGCQERPGL